MIANGTVFGVLNTFGIIYVVMRDEYAGDDPNVSFKTCKFLYVYILNYIKTGYIVKYSLHNLTIFKII